MRMSRWMTLLLTVEAMIFGANQTVAQWIAPPRITAKIVFASEEPTWTVTPTPTEIPEKIFTPDPIEQENYVRLAREILHDLADIRGVGVKTGIVIEFKGKEFFRQFLYREMREDISPEKEAVLVKVYRAMGLYQGKGDLIREELKEMLRGILGLYDPKTKKLYIAEWVDPREWEDTVPHEIAHALQDQHHDLRRYSDAMKGMTYDARISRACVYEGEATALTLEYRLRNEAKGKTLKDQEDVTRTNRINAMIELGRAWFRGERGRIRIRNYMGFVYAYGATFYQRALQERGWGGLADFYRDPPRSSAQIIHPEKYLGTMEKPLAIRIGGLEGTDGVLAGYRKIWEETFGEYGLSTILGTRLYDQDARASTVGWRGDVMQAYERPGDKNLVILGYAVFENETWADRYFDGYRDYLSKKIKPDGFIDWQENCYHILDPKTQRRAYLEIRGKRVVFIENVEEAQLKGLLGEIWPKPKPGG